MGIEFARTHIIGRAKGHTAVKAAAYRSGTRLHDARIGLTADYSHRASEVAHSEILLPADAPEALRDRETLWLSIEAAEDKSTRRSTAQLAKDHIIALPRELTLAQQIQLAKDFAQSQFVQHGVAVDLNVHLHSADNPHAHLMTTTRTIDADGIGKKARKLNGGFYNGQRLPEEEQLRHRWADFQNAWADNHGIDLSVTNNNGEWTAEVHRGPTKHMDDAAQRDTPEEALPERTDVGQVADQRMSERAQAIFENPRLLVNRVTSKKAFFTHHDLWRELFKHVSDDQDFQAIKAKLEQSDFIVPLHVDVALPDKSTKDRELTAPQAIFTSQQVLDDELQLRGYAKKMHRPDAHHGQLNAEAVASVKTDFGFLSEEQQAAVDHITDDKRVSVVVGFAGAGKSTMLDAARAVWARSGYRVRGLAPSGKAAEGLQDSAKIDSSTIHSFFYQLEKGKTEITQNDVFVIDEAGMVNTGLMLKAVRMIEEAGAKIVLVGDPEQLQPIQAGNPLRTIASKVGYSEISAIRRQREDWQRQATLDLARGDATAALMAYGQRGRITISDDRDGSIESLAEAVADRYAVGGRSQLALAHSRQDVKALNTQIRQKLTERGILGQQFSFDSKAVDNSGFAEKDALPDLDRKVEADETLSFAVHDRIVFLKNDKQLGVKNGTMGTVVDAGFNSLEVQTDEGKTVSFSVGDYAEVAHGFAVTVHKSQGVTVDDTHVLINRSWNKHLAYVAMSRHRDNLTIYSNEHSFHRGDEADVLAFADRQESVIDFAESHGLELKEDGQTFEQVSDEDLEAKAQAARALLDQETMKRQAEILAPLEKKAQHLKAELEKAKAAYRAHERSEKPKGLFKGKAAKAWESEKAKLEASRNENSGLWLEFERDRKQNRLDRVAREEARAEVQKRHPDAAKLVSQWSEQQSAQRAESRAQARGRGRSGR